MRGEELVLLAWSDLVGLTRGRGVPIAELDARLERGIGWPVARQALTPFAALAGDPWEALPSLSGAVRMMPDPASQLRIDLWEEPPPLNLMLCDALNPDGTPWEMCGRGFLRAALHDLEQEAGLRFLASVDLVFDLAGIALPPGPPFTLEAFRAASDFGALVVRALSESGAEPETFDPGYGAAQYGMRCRPAFGVAAGDRCAVNREVVREVARRMGLRASFAPAAGPDRPGNAAPIRFSLHRATLPAGFDTARPGGLSEAAEQFVAGILRHLPALCAFTAAGVASYLRLGSQRRYACCAVGNREAAIRICRRDFGIPVQVAQRFNLEYRPSDSTATPYLALGVVVRAGLQGIRERLPAPPLVEQDPDQMEEAERERLGLRRLPRSLAEALDRLEADATVRSWFPATLWDAYIAVKRAEIRIVDGASPQEVCDRYRSVY